MFPKIVSEVETVFLLCFELCFESTGLFELVQMSVTPQHANETFLIKVVVVRSVLNSFGRRLLRASFLQRSKNNDRCHKESEISHGLGIQLDSFLVDLGSFSGGKQRTEAGG